MAVYYVTKFDVIDGAAHMSVVNVGDKQLGRGFGTDWFEANTTTGDCSVTSVSVIERVSALGPHLHRATARLCGGLGRTSPIDKVGILQVRLTLSDHPYSGQYSLTCTANDGILNTPHQERPVITKDKIGDLLKSGLCYKRYYGTHGTLFEICKGRKGQHFVVNTGVISDYLARGVSLHCAVVSAVLTREKDLDRPLTYRQGDSENLFLVADNYTTDKTYYDTYKNDEGLAERYTFNSNKTTNQEEEKMTDKNSTMGLPIYENLNGPFFEAGQEPYYTNEDGDRLSPGDALINGTSFTPGKLDMTHPRLGAYPSTCQFPIYADLNGPFQDSKSGAWYYVDRQGDSHDADTVVSTREYPKAPNMAGNQYIPTPRRPWSSQQPGFDAYFGCGVQIPQSLPWYVSIGKAGRVVSVSRAYSPYEEAYPAIVAEGRVPTTVLPVDPNNPLQSWPFTPAFEPACVAVEEAIKHGLEVPEEFYLSFPGGGLRVRHVPAGKPSIKDLTLERAIEHIMEKVEHPLISITQKRLKSKAGKSVAEQTTYLAMSFCKLNLEDITFILNYVGGGMNSLSDWERFSQLVGLDSDK